MFKYEAVYIAVYIAVGVLIIFSIIIGCLLKKKYNNRLKKLYIPRLMSSSSINNNLYIENAEKELVTNYELLL